MDSSAYILTLMIMHTQCLPNTMHTYIYICVYVYCSGYFYPVLFVKASLVSCLVAVGHHGLGPRKARRSRVQQDFRNGSKIESCRIRDFRKLYKRKLGKRSDFRIGS